MSVTRVMALTKRWLMVSSMATFMRVAVLKECLPNTFVTLFMNSRRAFGKGFVTNGIYSAVIPMHEISILPSMDAICTSPMCESHDRNLL